MLIAVDIPDSEIDKVATIEEIDCPLTFNLTNFFIKSKFDLNFQHMYNKFMATSRDEIVFTLLTEEIDFKYYKQTGVILDYQYMHKGHIVEEIQQSFDKYYYKLLCGFLTFSGKWQKYI